MEITSVTLGMIFSGVAIATLLIIIYGSRGSKDIQKKEETKVSKEKTENNTDPIRAITNEKATKESTDKTASPTRFLLIPQIVAKIATKI